MSPDPVAIPGSRAGDDAGATFARVGATAPDFTAVRESLGDLGKDKAFEPIKDFKGWASSFIDAQKMIGSSIRLPKKDMKPEDREKAINELKGKLRTEGILETTPESPEKYEIKFPEEEGFKANEPLVKSFKNTAHKLGISPSHAQGLFDWYLNFQAESERTEQEEFETSKGNLKKEFGGLYTRRMEAARRAIAKYVGDDGDELISGLSPKAGVRILKAFAEIGDPLLEEEMIAGEIPGVVTMEQVQTKINAMVGDPKHALNDLGHPNHKAALAEYSKLNETLSRFQLQQKGRK